MWDGHFDRSLNRNPLKIDGDWKRGNYRVHFEKERERVGERKNGCLMLIITDDTQRTKVTKRGQKKNAPHHEF